MTKKETKKKILFTVAECGEMQAMGVYRDDIATIEEAINVYKAIDPEQMHGIPSIGIKQHVDGNESWMDSQVDIVTGTTIDLGYLRYFESELWSDTRVQEAVRKLIDAFPNYTVNKDI